MTANALTSAPTTKGLTRLIALFFMLALALAACSSDAPDAETSESTFPDKEAVSPGDESDDDSTVETTAPERAEDVDEANEPAEEGDEDDLPQSPPGTINELEDIIDNEADDMLDLQSNDSLVDRFVVALLADSDGLDFSEADARCAGETLETELSATSFELLVTNVETQDELDNGNQFTDAELLVISESLASCLDLRPLVQQVVGEDADLEGLTTCLARILDVDAVESLILFEILGENGERLVSPLILTGLELCPTETRIVIDNTILSEFLIADARIVEACLAEISTEDLRPFFETRAFGELIALLREQCLF